ncbi:MAG TPA: NAD(+) synthase [Firmicutes bacterium]|mgnify:CR=1 FL=1|nr:NAD(+) synthase [Bacillota bacterium]
MEARIDYQSLSEEMALWIYEHVRNAGAQGVVLGVSGGVDSAVTLLAARKAFPRDILGLIMPCGNHRDDERLARSLCESYDVPFLFLDLAAVFQPFALLTGSGKTAPDLTHVEDRKEKLALANIKARMRMTLLYAYAQKRNYLVLGTGNKTEIEIGYFTKYGDGGADLLPLGGLFKREVITLGRELGAPEEILKRVPSGGLWNGQTDEGEIGYTYDELEYGIRMFYGMPLAEERVIPEEPEKVETAVALMIQKAGHKCLPPPLFSLPGRERG